MLAQADNHFAIPIYLDMVATFAIRVASVYFGWRTKPVSPLGWMERR